MNHSESADPWYRHPWPWLLMAGPAIVVVAGLWTAGLALRSADGLVADDYYKQGKAINKIILRDNQARALGYVARLILASDGQVTLRFESATPPSPRLRLQLHHPTRAGFDRDVSLARVDDGSYRAALPAFDGARYGLTLEDDSRVWRLTGLWRANAASTVLGGTGDAQK